MDLHLYEFPKIIFGSKYFTQKSMDRRSYKAYLKMSLLKANMYKYSSINAYMLDLSKTEKLHSILDIGACVGAFSVQCRNLWPEAKLLMLEANTSCELPLSKTGIDYKICLLGNENRDNVIFYKS